MENIGIQTANIDHVQVLTEFQVNMALQTQNFKLNKDLVRQAITYFLKKGNNEHNSYGLILVRICEQQVLGSQLITIQNDDSWWFQSVYVKESARRKGHFSQLFKGAFKLAKNKHVKKMKLYAESSNQQAKNTYFKLGMKVIEDKMYSYDFVYGGFQLKIQNCIYTIRKIKEQSQIQSNWLINKLNILTGEKYVQNDWNFAYAIQKDSNLVGVTKLFYQFSEWRFGLMWYVRQLYVNNNDKALLQSILNQIMNKLFEESELKVAAVRVLYRQSQNLSLNDGHKQPYDILQIQL